MDEFLDIIENLNNQVHDLQFQLAGLGVVKALLEGDTLNSEEKRAILGAFKIYV